MSLYVRTRSSNAILPVKHVYVNLKLHLLDLSAKSLDSQITHSHVLAAAAAAAAA